MIPVEIMGVDHIIISATEHQNLIGMYIAVGLCAGLLIGWFYTYLYYSIKVKKTKIKEKIPEKYHYLLEN